MKRSKATKERKWTDSEFKLVLESNLPIKDMEKILNRTEGSINMVRRKAQMAINGMWRGNDVVKRIKKILLEKYSYLR